MTRGIFLIYHIRPPKASRYYLCAEASLGCWWSLSKEKSLRCRPWCIGARARDADVYVSHGRDKSKGVGWVEGRAGALNSQQTESGGEARVRVSGQ